MLQEQEEQYPPVFCYLNDNHTSVIGMRDQIYQNSKCSIYSIHEQPIKLNEFKCNLIEKGDLIKSECRKNNNLFVYPAQSNFNGRKYSLDLISLVHSNEHFADILRSTGDWFVCLDTACLLSTSELDLTLYKPDFCVVSFYKMFGFPTGLGCLLVKKSLKCLNNKKYYGGGTINGMLIDKNLVNLKQNEFHDYMEDGTVSYLDIIALNVSIDKFNELTFNIGFKLIRFYLNDLTDYLYKKLNDLKHFNDQRLVEIYRNNNNNNNNGPIIAFNLLNSKNKYISFNLVDKLAQQDNIHLRTGCFCNIGACQMFMKHLKENNNYYQQGHKCGDHIDLINEMPTGAIRISLGYCSIRKDVDHFLNFLIQNFLETTNSTATTQLNNKSLLINQYFKITQIYIYPIKSCAPMLIKHGWMLKPSSNGFIYDRNWCIVDGNNVPLTQKRMPKLTQLRPLLNLNTNSLELTFNNASSFNLKLKSNWDLKENNVFIYPNNVSGLDEGNEVMKWLETNLNESKCRLIRINDNESNFYNKEAYLLVNEKSVAKLNTSVLQFRPNLVVSLVNREQDENDFDEEQWTHLSILNKNIQFKVADRCNRCQMININQNKLNEKNFSLLKDIYKLKSDSKFGIYLTSDSANENNLNQNENFLEIGDIGIAYTNN